jgi:dihydrofolate reductase
MPNLIASINMTLDGISDHTAVNPGADVHQHYEELLHAAGAMLYGRTTFKLMEFWRTFLTEPSGNAYMDKFAQAIDRVPKIVFSRTLRTLDWKTAQLAHLPPEEMIPLLKKQAKADLYVGSPGLIASLSNQQLIEEYQICVHPVIAGQGKRLFGDVLESLDLTLLKTKTFASGAVILYYRPTKSYL